MDPDAEDAAFVANANPLYFIGDSHTLAYADLIFKDLAGEFVVTRANDCRGITANAFLERDGGLYPDIVGALLAVDLGADVAAELRAGVRIPNVL